MARATEKIIRRNAALMKWQFLNAGGSDGGIKPDFIKLGLDHRDRLLKDTSVEIAFDDMLVELLSNVWEEKNEESKQLYFPLIVAGVELDSVISFRDPTVKVGMRKVLNRYATIRQHRKHCALLKEKRDEVGEKWKRELLANETALERASGNLDALMKDFVDNDSGDAA